MSKIPKRLRAATTAAAAAALVIAPLTFVATGAQAAEAHVDNPYAGATQYVNPTWSAAVESAATRASDASLAAKMRAIKSMPTAVWMDRISAIAGNADGNGLKFHLDNAVAQKKAGTPLVFNLVIYDLPGRDCYALASNGELPATDAGLARYKTEYIDPIAALLADPKYQDIRIAATIEPDSLPNLITNIAEPTCQQAAPYYREGVKYALDKLHAIPNVYNYIDAAHSGWLGWDSNAGPAAKLFADVAKTTKAGFASIDGFVTNTANTTPLVEPFLTDPTKQVGSGQVRSAKFYEWNPDFDEIDWTAHLHRLLVAEGFPATTGMLIDTSRNGWGGPARPTAASTSTTLDTYVDQSRIDKRVHRGAWCNPLGAGIGERPQATPSGYAASHLDAFVWIKPPGESDGASSEIPNDQGKRFDRMCDPTFNSPKLAGALTGATPNAPLAGQWFEDQFVTLVKNAYPVIEGTGPVDPTDTTAPTAPSGVTAGTVTNTSVALSWTASTDAVGVTGYDVYQGATRVGTSTSTSYTVTGLTANTAYSFTVRARDAAGNVSSPSTAVSVRTTNDTTVPPVDTTAPTAPSGLVAGAVTQSSAAISWTASTDAVGVTGYEIFSNGTSVGTSTTTSFTATGLTAATAYSFTVKAKDAAGNVSAASTALSVTTKPGDTVPAGACSVTYAANSWNSGFTASVKVKNTGTTPLTNWKLTFSFANGQAVQQGWSATWSQSGSTVTAAGASWNSTLAPGATADIGFNGSHSGTNNAPTAFAVNGAVCTNG
ncbi:glycoside hydrolase family 6 protein [Cellulomonas sp. NS3]|uniref:glycoside hydrolase family 6 protein n=1 Tax=Cellulomonas sp. NS3 TaxID=2973977 RepID=UPI0021620D00|nr:glycoside hydrolase family 6 protein [Cellulomonas sp. NS3]